MAYADIIIDQNGKTKCELCKIFIRDSNIFIVDHLNDKEHAKMFMKRLMIQNNIVVNGKKISCCLCNRVADASEVLHHIDSSEHEGIIRSVRKIIEKDGGLLVLPENISNLGSAVSCLACNCCVDFNHEAIESHIESSIHRRARAIAIQPSNGIFSVEDNHEDLWCKICQVYFENFIEVIFEHVDGDPGHIKNLGKIHMLIKEQNISIEKFLYDPKEDKAFCKQCGIEVPCNIDNLDSHIRGKQHIKSSATMTII